MSYPNYSTEASVLHAVIEGREDDAIKVLAAHFNDSELIEYHETLGKIMDLVLADATRRGLRT
jgi:hypothetical protein